MVKVRVSVERIAAFMNELEIEAESIEAAVKQANEKMEDIIWKRHGLELGIGNASDNPSAYMVTYSPKIVGIAEVVEDGLNRLSITKNGRNVEVK